ncbi:sulfurtransferase-like selenium metabolism protein YedF [Proteiniborus sp. MB09-C3]|uniref:sulfurtransferase-like selenium metabolism protein YedF n=1 Tax=Proteiniborus sp. MB09-C3 TaxID=3050072 RepID=UPI0025572204|nr:sulfurtransferase-like selenium metabolism protein YedF [Proteiniborus sp. MB09-C3]WIV12531.1 sulfurtransferase-like selenium metabolism protein YedF [Proteiniborus sp. MB09-C3]
MKKEIDARNQACPKPVIMTKKALDETSEGVVTTIVDNEVAKENVSKLAKSLNFDYTVEKRENEYYIHITKGAVAEEVEEANACVPNTFKDTVILFGNDKLGQGSEELGNILIKGYIYTLTESTPFPSTLLFLNGGVRLTVEGSPVLDDLKKLKSEGVEILSCGTCLDFYSLKEKLAVGEITNMYTIVEKMKNATNTITL